MKPGPNDVKLAILITGDELHELKRFTTDMVEAFGLDRRIEEYSGKRSMTPSRSPQRRSSGKAVARAVWREGRRVA